MDDANPSATAFVESGGFIVDMMKNGSSFKSFLAAFKKKHPSVEVREVDLKTQTVLPGFVEPHGHSVSGAMDLVGVNVGNVYTPVNPTTQLDLPGCATMGEVWNRIKADVKAKKRQYLRRLIAKPAVLGYGFDVSSPCRYPCVFL